MYKIGIDKFKNFGLIFILLNYINNIYKKKYPPLLPHLGDYFYSFNREATVIGALRYYYNTTELICQLFFNLIF